MEINTFNRMIGELNDRQIQAIQLIKSIKYKINQEGNIHSKAKSITQTHTRSFWAKLDDF
jgi:hypothetical protein